MRKRRGAATCAHDIGSEALVAYGTVLRTRQSVAIQPHHCGLTVCVSNIYSNLAEACTRYYEKTWSFGLLRFETTIQRPLRFPGSACTAGFRLTSGCSGARRHGIVFRRSDLDFFAIPASWKHVARVSYATSLMRQGVLISTTEHLLSTLYSFGIDNVSVEIDNLEVPILDGSSAPFMELIRRAGVRQLRRKRRYLRITRPVTVEDGRKRISILPDDRFRLTCEIDFPAPIGKQSLEMEMTPERYRQPDRARPHIRREGELDQMREMGLIRGASLDCAVCFTDSGVLNPEGLRFADEMLPAQGARSDRRPGFDRPAAAGPRDRGAGGTCHAHGAGGEDHGGRQPVSTRHAGPARHEGGGGAGFLTRLVMPGRKKTFDAKKEIRAIARERVGTVKPAQVITPKAERKPNTKSY